VNDTPHKDAGPATLANPDRLLALYYQDIRAIARIAGRSFDHLILRRDDDLRGRGSDEVPKMMEAELLASGFPAERMTLIPDEQTAIDSALRMAKRGDLLLVFADKVSRSWKQVIYFKPEHEDKAPSAPPPAAPSAPLPPALGSSVDLSQDLGGATVIQDERGVRIAREQDD